MSNVVEHRLFQARPAWLESVLHIENVEVIAPVNEDGKILFAPVTSGAQIATDYVNVLVPLKEQFFPKSDVLLAYRKDNAGEVEVEATPTSDRETIVLGSRPCDAASLELLDEVFRWDYEDVQYKQRRENTTVVSWACMRPGPRCFCTSVGGSPHGAAGSDVLVFSREGQDDLLQVLTEKGQRFVERLGDSVQPGPAGLELPTPPELDVRFDSGKTKAWLDEHFEDDFWIDVALRCLGCGACSFLCPTCHCFDIVDESTWKSGRRLRNWDCCSFRLFTLHASGHNPRPNQTARCRQRIMHKFKYFQERFGKIACVGCGRCAQNCGVGQNLVSILTKIESL